MMSNFFKRVFLFSFLLSFSFFFLGCKDDPYPETGSVVARQTVEEEVLPELSLAISDVVEFHEGRRGSFLIRGTVADPGVPEISVENLPAGATFHKETSTISWIPDHFAGNDSSDPSIKSRIYPIIVELRSSLDIYRAVRKTVNLVVYDIPQYIKITPSSQKSVDEGKKYSNTFTIENPDYPKGPFKVLLKGMPANIKLTQLSSTRYRLDFSPDFDHVKRTEDSEVRYKGTIVVSNPANHIAEEPLNIVVRDVRQKAKLVGPGSVTQGLDVSLQVAAYDLNKEVAPQIELLSTHPRYGQFKFSESENKENFSSVLNINWTDIPPSHNGETIELHFRACVLSFSGHYENCSFEKVKVTIAVRKRKAPVIDRSSWPVEELIYLGFGESFEKKIPIYDREDSSLKPKVEIFPEQMRRYISWSGNQLRLHLEKEGIFQFNLKATSDYEVSSTESFLVEVFPRERNKILVFADSTRDPEMIFYGKTFKNMDIMNPAIQKIQKRNLAHRETLVLTTSALLDKAHQESVMKAIERIDNIVVASPLLENLPEKFYTRLREKYDMDPIGRLSQLPNPPELSKVRFLFTDHFRAPINLVGLRGRASLESRDPLIFNGGLYDSRKNCKGVLGISETERNPLVIGMSCQRTLRPKGGRIALLGTEWADLRTEASDSEIPLKWFDTLLKGDFNEKKGDSSSLNFLGLKERL